MGNINKSNSCTVKEIGFGYIVGKDSHSVVMSVNYHLSKIKDYNSEGFEKLDDFNFSLFNILTGRNRGVPKINRDFELLDRLYIFDEDFEELKNSIDENLLKDKVVLVNKSFFKKTKNTHREIPLSNLFLARVFFDIDNNFRSLQDKTVYTYSSPKDIIRNGKKGIEMIKIGDFEDFVKRSFCPYSYPKTFDNIEDLYIDALNAVQSEIDIKKNMISSFEDSIKTLKSEVEKQEENYNTLKSLKDIGVFD